MKDAFQYLEESKNQYVRGRRDKLINDLVDGPLREAIVAGTAAIVMGLSTGGLTAAAAAEGLAIYFSTVLPLELTWYAVRFHLDITNYNKMVYQPAALEIRRDCEQLTPSSGIVYGQ
ncbi:MAG: hypothetical protein ACK5UT_12335 [Acidobacteriota bacterium]|jgi:hypothetical protein